MTAVHRLLAQEPAVPLEVIVVDATPDGGGLPWLMYPGKPWAHLMIQ